MENRLIYFLLKSFIRCHVLQNIDYNNKKLELIDQLVMNKFFTRSLIIVFTSVVALLFAADGQLSKFPLIESGENWKPLLQTRDSLFGAELESRLLQNKQWASLIRRGKMSVGLVDLSDPQAVRFAEVNGDSMIYAASLPKIGILLAAFQGFEDGSLQESEQTYSELTKMIRVSDNKAATRMIDRLGFQKIETVLTNPHYRLYDQAYGGGIWVGKRYAKRGERHPDPIKGLSHGANATQVCRFYYLLASGELIDAERSRQMLEILSHPKINHKFVHSLNESCPGVPCYRKSGSWRNWHADSVLVWGEGWQRYILVGLVKDAHGEQILRDLLPVAEEILRN